jgi:hypothetical protein
MYGADLSAPIYLDDFSSGFDESNPYNIKTKNLKRKAKNHNSKFKTFFLVFGFEL